jgi:coenzyme Q-binding protein COQ10
MPSFRAKRQVYHSADQMFDLVADVESYSEFVPLCQSHTIASRKKCGDSEILMTDMTVAYRIFRETHRSRVNAQPGQRTHSGRVDRWSAAPTPNPLDVSTERQLHLRRGV